jgi:hypothetical protein
MSIRKELPDDLVQNILSYVNIKACQRIDHKSARKWFPVSSLVEEECRKKRILRSQNKYFRRIRNQLYKEWEDVLESSDPWDAQEEWVQRYEDIENEYTNFILTKNKGIKKKVNDKQLYQEDVFHTFFEQ